MTFPVLYLGPNEFIGLIIEAGVIEPSLDPIVELIVPAREETTEEPFIIIKVSARS